MDEAQILIIDCGSQYTLLIQRALAEIGLKSHIMKTYGCLTWIAINKPKGIIISGGPSSVYDENAPLLPRDLLKDRGIPILGICYGMQWLANTLQKGSVESNPNSQHKGYGPEKITHYGNDILFQGVPFESNVWSSHGDYVRDMPSGFIVTATSTNFRTAQGMWHEEYNFRGIQFHPEVKDTEYGSTILSNFVYNICGCKSDWDVEDIATQIENEIDQAVGGEHASMGTSGGVDSTVLALLAVKVLGDRFHPFIIDHGAMRQGEIPEVMLSLKKAGIPNVKLVDASDAFFREMPKYVDAQDKRIKGFQPLYRQIFVEESLSVSAGFILQGTIAPDQIESGTTGGSVIKTHHNVDLKFPIPELMPFGKLYKYQVRDLARKLNLPKEISERQPFPGPGLFLRVVGSPATKFNVGIARNADATVINILKKYSLYDNVSQLVVAYLGTPTAGVKGDQRSYKGSILIHPVKTVDFMTSGPYRLPLDVEDEIITAVCKHPEINRVLFDYNTKPPATTEYE